MEYSVKRINLFFPQLELMDLNTNVKENKNKIVNLHEKNTSLIFISAGQLNLFLSH